jgi:hypothetical protein
MQWWLKKWQPSTYFVDILIPHARRLQGLWLEKHGTAYSEIDKQRRREMLGRFGAFRGISFNPTANNDEELFIVHKSHHITVKPKLFGAQGFEPAEYYTLHNV